MKTYRFMHAADIAFTVKADSERQAIDKATIAMERLLDGLDVDNILTIDIDAICLYPDKPMEGQQDNLVITDIQEETP